MEYESIDTTELYKALAKFDEKTINLEPDKTGNRNHKYVSKGLILKNTRKELKDCGLRFMRTTTIIDGKQYIVTTLKHIPSGQFVRSAHFYHNHEPLDNAAIQTLGGLRTYITRYEIMDMLYLDDCAPDPDEPITAEQLKELEKLANNNMSAVNILCNSFKVSELRNIPYYQFAAASQKLKLIKKELGQ